MSHRPDNMVLTGDCRALMPAHGPFDLIHRRSALWRHLARLGPARRRLAVARACRSRSRRSLWVFGSLRCFMATAAAFRDAGWKYAQEIVWEKQNGSSFHAGSLQARA